MWQPSYHTDQTVSKILPGESLAVHSFRGILLRGVYYQVVVVKSHFPTVNQMYGLVHYFDLYIDKWHLYLISQRVLGNNLVQWQI